MSGVYDISDMWLDCDCSQISGTEFDKLTENSVKADGRKIKKLIKKFQPAIYDQLQLRFPNPYEDNCMLTDRHLIFCHSAIEYFFRYKRE